MVAMVGTGLKCIHLTTLQLLPVGLSLGILLALLSWLSGCFVGSRSMKINRATCLPLLLQMQFALTYQQDQTMGA